jgi:hypothetical protein
MSKGSAHFQNEQRKNQQVDAKISALKARASTLSEADLMKHQRCKVELAGHFALLMQPALNYLPNDKICLAGPWSIKWLCWKQEGICQGLGSMLTWYGYHVDMVFRFFQAKSSIHSRLSPYTMLTVSPPGLRMPFLLHVKSS